MANYQVMFWKHIPSQVKAWDGGAEAKKMLPDYFQAAIDAYAMKDGSTDADAYLEGWRWGPVEERPGQPDEVVGQLIAELTAANPRSRLLNPA
ncbi:MAG TPA: virulence factor [Candidatus Limnocylindrales bacterium]|nr:virulence factor [Candidatus Limnocylindrales bacterium]